MERATGLEHLTMPDIAPPEFGSLAAGAGFENVSVLGVEAVVPGPGGGLTGCQPVLETAAALGARYARQGHLPVSVEAPSAPARAELGPARYAARAWRTLDELLR